MNTTAVNCHPWDGGSPTSDPTQRETPVLLQGHQADSSGTSGKGALTAALRVTTTDAESPGLPSPGARCSAAAAAGTPSNGGQVDKLTSLYITRDTWERSFGGSGCELQMLSRAVFP